MTKFDQLINEILSEDWRSTTASGLLGLGMLATNTPNVNAKQPVTTKTVSKTIPRGIKNNNPGNIEAKGNWKDWGGAIDNDGRFIVFNSPEYGIRAMGKILKNYNKKYKLETIDDVINRWAPPQDDNNTNQYINNVSKWTGIAKDEKLNFDDPNTLYKLITSIIKQETSHTYDPKVIFTAINLIDKEF